MAIHGRTLVLILAGLACGGFPALIDPVQAQGVPQSLVQAPPPPMSLSPWGQIAPPPAAETDDEPEAAAPVAADPADPAKDVDVGNLDWSQLSPNGAVSDRPAAAVKGASKAKTATTSTDMNWSNQNNANGSAAVSVKQSVVPFWDARIGADMTVAKQPGTMSELLAEKAENGGGTPQSGGSAWAAVTAPGAGSIWDKTAVEARVDPGSDQSKIGTTLSKAVPLIDQYNLTLQNGYNITQQGMVPLPGAAPRTNRSYDTEQSAKLAIGSTGTSLSAGQTLSSGDDKWLRRVGAEQQLYDGVTVSGSVGQTAQGATSKSISAGFKRSW